MDNLKLFKFEERNVEVILVNNEPLFNARHIGECLELSNVRKIIGNFDTDEVVKVTSDYIKTCSAVTNGYSRIFNNMGELFLTEPGIYKLIFISRKPEAKKFQKWVTKEVLSEIRKQGLYATEKKREELLSDPDAIIELCQRWKAEKLAKEKAIQERTWISNKRKATAMNTASQAVKKANKLSEELGMTKKWASILRVALALGMPEKNYNWRLLKKASLEIGKPPRKIVDPRFGYANVYPAEAWYMVYDVILKDLF